MPDKRLEINTTDLSGQKMALYLLGKMRRPESC
nr:unnamed protein product [Callosobruchus chinensis]